MRLIFLLNTLVFMASCTSGQNKQEDRINTIYKSIEMMERYDSLGLILIIDTSYCYDVYGYEGFDNIIKYVNKKIKICPKPVKEKLKIEYNEALEVTEIFVPFKCAANDTSNHDQFELLFRFFDYEPTEKIGFINIIKYSQLNKPERTIDLPGIIK